MVLGRIYLLPHGDELIDLPDSNAEKMANRIRKITAEDDSEVIVIASPHGVRLSKNIAVVNTENFHGSFTLERKRLEKHLKNEKALAERILEMSEIAEEVAFVTTSGDKSVFPLDFGTLIPLEFFPEKPIVYLGQSRLSDIGKLKSFGESLYKSLETYRKKVSLIISADQAHTHSQNGPYGYSEKAVPYESEVMKALETNDFTRLVEMDPDVIVEAKPDSYWNLIVLSSILEKSGRSMIIDYHYVADYFGMICAHSD